MSLLKLFLLNFIHERDDKSDEGHYNNLIKTKL